MKKKDEIKVCLVGSSGGHLTHLYMLKPFWKDKKLNKYGSIGYENYNCKGYLGFIISFMIPSILRAQDKKSVLKATIQGVCDGKRSKPGEWSAEI